jgi:hypothetical protein
MKENIQINDRKFSFENMIKIAEYLLNIYFISFYSFFTTTNNKPKKTHTDRQTRTEKDQSGEDYRPLRQAA